jgi:hypothetical protein
VTVMLPPNTPPIPTTHPGTGAPFVNQQVNVRAEDEVFEWGPPIKPSRYSYDYDDDGNELRVELTDKQLAEAMADYERAMEKWRRTGGRLAVAGPVSITARLVCADGSWAEYLTGPGAASWIEMRWEGVTRR